MNFSNFLTFAEPTVSTCRQSEELMVASVTAAAGAEAAGAEAEAAKAAITALTISTASRM